jgi:hypothetical protein
MAKSDPNGRRPTRDRDADSSHQQAADSDVRKARTNPLSEVAILVVGAIDSPTELRRQRYCTEVAVAVSDGSVACWHVEPEPDWVRFNDGEAVPAQDESHKSSREPGRGLPAAVVAAELAEVLEGRRVYSDSPRQVLWWLNALFESTGTVRTFEVRPISELASSFVVTKRFAEAAGHVAWHNHRDVPRAANEALGYWEWMSLLARIDPVGRPGG